MKILTIFCESQKPNKLRKRKTIIQYLSSHCILTSLEMVSSLTQFHRTWETCDMKKLLENTCIDKHKLKIHTERGKAPFFWPIDGRIIHFIYNNKQLWHTQGFGKLNMLTGLSTSLISSFKFPLSSRYYLITERWYPNTGHIKYQCREQQMFKMQDHWISSRKLITVLTNTPTSAWDAPLIIFGT